MLIVSSYSARVDGPPKISGIPSDVASVPEPNTMGYGFDDEPNCTHNVFYDYLASQNQKATLFYIGSNVLDWPLEAQRGLADDHEICARQCFPFLFFYGADFFCRVTDTWSHRYSELLLVCSCYNSQDLMLPSLSSDCFPSEGAFAELWYSVRTLFTPKCQHRPC